MPEFNEWLQEARKAAGLSQAKLGAMIGISKVKVSNWETGKAEPTDEQVKMLREALGEGGTEVAHELQTSEVRSEKVGISPTNNVPAGPAQKQLNGFSEITSFIWSVSDLLRGVSSQSEYPRVILPFMVLRFLGQFDFAEALVDQKSLPQRLRSYINECSPQLRDVLVGFDFNEQVQHLHRAGVLVSVVKMFATRALAPERLSSEERARIFDGLIQKFADTTDGFASSVTPVGVGRLMVAVLLAGDDRARRRHEIVVNDPACGTGVLLAQAARRLAALNPESWLTICGQDLNAEAEVTCRARSLLAEGNAWNVHAGNVLAHDQHPALEADYLICHPPFGLAWGTAEEAVREEHKTGGNNGRFGPGLPRRSDGTLLFLLHMVSKMKPAEQGGSRLAFLSWGSPLWSGGAGSGESEIRRYLVENDLLEAVVVLPDRLFPHTEIPTYIWVLSNRKQIPRRGNVKLIDASDFYDTEQALGQKRQKAIAERHVAEIVRLLEEVDEGPLVRVFNNEDFGSLGLTINRPLRLAVEIDSRRFSDLERTRAWRRLKDDSQQDAILRVLRRLEGKVFDDRDAWRSALSLESNDIGVQVSQAVLRATESVFGRRSEGATVCMNAGRPEADPSLRRYVEVPQGTNVETYLDSEVRPRTPNAWLVNSEVAFAIHRITHLGFRLSREVALVREQYQHCQLKPLGEVCAEIRRRKDSGRGPDPSAEDPLSGIPGLREVRVVPDDGLVSSHYLAMFFSTDTGKKLLATLSEGTMLPRVDLADLSKLPVPVPTLEEQEGVLKTRRRIEDLAEVLDRVEAELAANPRNVVTVSRTIVPMLQVLGQLSDSDEVRERIRAGESKRVEFKQSFSLDVRKQTKETYIEDSALKTIVAFLNSDGGDLLLGVADDGQVPGLEPELNKFHKANTDKFLLHVKNRLKKRIGEPCYPLIDQRLVEMDDASVLWVACKASKRPVFLDDTDFYVRTNPATDMLVGRKMHEYINARFK